jgi:hypothetical protein
MVSLNMSLLVLIKLANCAVSATSSSCNPSTTSSATGGASNVAALPLSMGLLSWPGGLPGGLRCVMT